MVRGGGPAPDYKDVSLCDFSRRLIRRYGVEGIDATLDDFELSEVMTESLLDGVETREGLIATLYTVGWAFSSLREQLKLYEDTGLTPEEIAALCAQRETKKVSREAGAMREIEFRGKRWDNGEWLYGSLIVLDEGCTLVVPPYHGASTLSKDALVRLRMKAVDSSTVGQYTGMDDKTGKKIFEGDIIKGDRGPAFVVEYVETISSFAVRIRNDTRWSPCLNSGTMRHYAVIGNRWDNPELWEEEQDAQ